MQAHSQKKRRVFLFHCRHTSLAKASVIDHSLFQQLVAVNCEHVWVLLYAFVHQGLREHGLVLLVVTEPSIPYDVYDHVVVELCPVSLTYHKSRFSIADSRNVPVFAGDFAAVSHQIGIVRVYMKYGSIYNACDVRTVDTGPGVPRIGSETDL